MADLRDAEMEEGDRLLMFAGVGGTKVQAQAGVCAQGTLDRGGKLELFDKYLAAKINPGERASIYLIFTIYSLAPQCSQYNGSVTKQTEDNTCKTLCNHTFLH